MENTPLNQVLKAALLAAARRVVYSETQKLIKLCLAVDEVDREERSGPYRYRTRVMSSLLKKALEGERFS